MDVGYLVSGLLISGFGTVLIVYGKKMGRFPPAMVGVAMWVYPFFVFNLWLLWGITGAMCVVLYLMREKE